MGSLRHFCQAGTPAYALHYRHGGVTGCGRRDDWHHSPHRPRWRDVALPAVAFAWFALLGLINFPLGRFFNFTGVHLAGVSRTAPVLAGAPLVAMTLGITLGGETLTPLIALGTAAIVGGVVLIVSERAA